MYNQSELMHYGVLGMKWGVRRYQNYDGTYTQKGLAKYKKAESKYEKAKTEMKNAKSEMKKTYKKLKTDKAADQGKALYRSGNTISENNRKNEIANLAIFAGGTLAIKALQTSQDQRISQIAPAVISAGGTAVSAALLANTMSKNRKLRAYYAH